MFPLFKGWTGWLSRKKRANRYNRSGKVGKRKTTEKKTGQMLAFRELKTQIQNREIS